MAIFWPFFDPPDPPDLGPKMPILDPYSGGPGTGGEVPGKGVLIARTPPRVRPGGAPGPPRGSPGPEPSPRERRQPGPKIGPPGTPKKGGFSGPPRTPKIGPPGTPENGPPGTPKIGPPGTPKKGGFSGAPGTPKIGPPRTPRIRGLPGESLDSETRGTDTRLSGGDLSTLVSEIELTPTQCQRSG